MRHRGGGIGHKSTWSLNAQLLQQVFNEQEWDETEDQATQLESHEDVQANVDKDGALDESDDSQSDDDDSDGFADM